MTAISDRTDDRRTRRATLLIVAALAYLPPLLTRPGWIAADTKAYLFLDPGRLLSRAAEMWDANVSLGTVTHQNIGYLFPLGPYFWLVDHLPIPMWVGQRIWIGTTLFAAGAGFVWLARRLSLGGWAVLAGALVYMLSPYTLAYLGRTTVILLPWAALPWLIGLARRAAHEGGWRAPAWFALVVTIVGGINASSLLFIGLAPVLWFPFAVWVSREIDLRQAITAMLRIGVLLVPTQLWWVAGLSVQASYGLPILELTESVKTVAQTSSAAEVARHLGYWYFYGRDGLEPWTEASRFFTQNPVSILVSFAIPAMAAIAAFVVRWRVRSYAVLLVIVGAFIGIGTHPYADPPPAGALIQSAADFSTAGMAMRNSPRAVPLMVLGTTLLLTAALAALGPVVARWRVGAFAGQLPQQRSSWRSWRSSTFRPCGPEASSSRTSSTQRTCRTTGTTWRLRSTIATTGPGCSRSPAWTSVPTVGATPRTSSRRASSIGSGSVASSSPTERRHRPT